MEEELAQEDHDDLDEYTFSKFASINFQGAASPTHVRQRLRQPLLYHEDEGDVSVLLSDVLNSSFQLLCSDFINITVLCLSVLARLH